MKLTTHEKTRRRNKILTDEFLNRGGVIQKIKIGVMTTANKTHKDRKPNVDFEQ